MKLSEFDDALPPELIAQHPAPERTASRLLDLDGATGALRDLAFADLPGLVDGGDTLVLNDTRVLKARLFGRKASGGKVELFVERIVGEHEALGLMRAGHSPKAGTRLTLGANLLNNLDIFSPKTADTVQPTNPALPAGTPASPTPTPGIGSTMTGKDGMTLLFVPAGKFTAGSDSGDDDEKPIHTVTLDAFWIDRTEITNKMYSLCVEEDACEGPTNTSSSTHSSYYGNTDFDIHPVIYVDWNMAKTYCEWADRRLPTEVEWEKAARGENSNAYPWGSTFEANRANICDKNCPMDWADKSSDDGFADVAPVGSYPNGASVYGALDMAGNVWEWVNDWYSESYDSSSPSSNPAGPSSGQNRVLRGGSWVNDSFNVRSSDRNLVAPAYTLDSVAFRCALSADEQAESSVTQPSATEASTPSSALDIGSRMTGEDGHHQVAGAHQLGG